MPKKLFTCWLFIVLLLPVSAQAAEDAERTGIMMSPWQDATSYGLGWQYRYGQPISDPYQPAINYSPGVNGTHQVFPYLKHALFVQVSAAAVSVNFFYGGNGPYSGILDLNNGKISSTVWNKTNSTFFGQSSGINFTNISGYYSEIRSGGDAGTVVSFLPKVAVLEGSHYKLVEGPLPAGIKNAGIQAAGEKSDLYQTAVFNGSTYSRRTLSVIGKASNKVFASLDIGLNYVYLQQDNWVLLYGIAAETSANWPIRYKKKYQQKKKVTSSSLAMMKEVGFEVVSLLCDLNSKQSNPCVELPKFTTNEQSFVGLNSATQTYVIEDGSVSPHCLYEVGFGSAVANPPDGNYQCAINAIPLGAKEQISTVKVSADGNIALMTVTDYTDSSSPVSTLWVYLGYSYRTYGPPSPVELLRAFDELVTLLGEHNDITIEIIHLNNGVYQLFGHNEKISLRLDIRRESSRLLH